MCMGIATIQSMGEVDIRASLRQQRTRKKKAAVALARKIAVLAWALMRDDKDWDPNAHD